MANSHDWNHQTVNANGISIHYVRHGNPADDSRTPLVLIHGWPEFWYTWSKTIPALAETYDVIAPDLRGFGDTEKPDTLPRMTDYVRDLVGLLDALGIERAGLIAHDVGAYIAQGFAMAYPDRVSGLFFFNCPYPGIGKRWVDPTSVNEIWYQSFNQLDWAPALLRSSPEACRLYFGNLLAHWSGDPDTFTEELDIWVENFLKPGNLEGGFAWYRSLNDARLALIRDGAPRRPKIAVPTYVYWGGKDPVLRAEWTDRLDDYFTHVTVEIAEDAGHFVHYETPDAANERIDRFFGDRNPQ